MVQRSSFAGPTEYDVDRASNMSVLLVLVLVALLRCCQIKNDNREPQQEAHRTKNIRPLHTTTGILPASLRRSNYLMFAWRTPWIMADIRSLKYMLFEPRAVFPSSEVERYVRMGRSFHWRPVSSTLKMRLSGYFAQRILISSIPAFDSSLVDVTSLSMKSHAVDVVALHEVLCPLLAGLEIPDPLAYCCRSCGVSQQGCPGGTAEASKDVARDGHLGLPGFVEQINSYRTHLPPKND